MRLVESGFLDEHSVQQLANRLGVSERRLRGLFVEHLGVAPNAIAKSRRAHDGTRRSFTLSLAYRPPLRWAELIAFLGKRAVNGVEEVTGSSYRRSISIGGTTGILDVRPGRSGGSQVAATLEGVAPAELGHAVRRIRKMFDLDADPVAIAGHLSRDSRLAPLVAALPGMRLPLTWDPFEAIVRAVLGQQISVAGAITIAGRLARRFGRPIAGAGTITRVFPVPSQLAHADLSTIGIPAARAKTLAEVSRAVLDGRLRLDGSVAPDKLEKDFQLIRGIGPWSAHYVALRGLGEPDAFPESDLGIRKALDALGFPGNGRQRREAIDLLAPWRGYAAIYLWHSLSTGG